MLQQKQGWSTEAKVRTWQSDDMQQSEGQGRSQPYRSIEGQDKELQVLRAGARNGTEQPRRSSNNGGHQRAVMGRKKSERAGGSCKDNAWV